ncbi:MAG: argininosuccinate lyase [Firmicutes bacterium]|nr:argininosuccinate lyase [Bacillota bacterium]
MAEHHSTPPDVSRARNPRFQKAMDRASLAFTASVGFDWRLLPYDVKGSIAHATMLAQRGIISQAAAERIVEGLKTILRRYEAGELTPRLEWEDVHMNVEGHLFELIGPEAGMLHTARSRNDQVALDMHLYMKDQGQQLRQELEHLIAVLIRRAESDFGVVIPGYTHLQAAQPVLLSHHWLAYVAMLGRDHERLSQWLERVDCSPLGAGALAGTPYPTDPAATAEALGLSKLYENSLDAVSDRDFLLEFLAWASILMVHLSRLGEELVLWSSQEFGYVTMDDGYSTGSSMMPQKKNPDVAELVRGKSGRVFGHLLGLLTVMKGLPLAYHSDMQEDKEAVFDVVDTLHGVLPVAAGMLATLRVNGERIRTRVGRDFSAATDLADLLVARGVPFREAHHRVGQLVGQLEASGRGFDQVSDRELAELLAPLQREDLARLKPEALVAARTQSFATAPEQVQAALRRAKARWGLEG